MDAESKEIFAHVATEQNKELLRIFPYQPCGLPRPRSMNMSNMV